MLHHPHAFFALGLCLRHLAGCLSRSRQFTNAHQVIECSPVLADYMNLPPASLSAVLSEDRSGLTHSPDSPRKPEFRVGALGSPQASPADYRTCGTKSGRSRWFFSQLSRFNPRPALPSPGHWGTLQDESRCSKLGWKHKITLIIRVLNPRKVRGLEKLLLAIIFPLPAGVTPSARRWRNYRAKARSVLDRRLSQGTMPGTPPVGWGGA